MVAVILAGGENKRIPIIKSFIEIEGKPILSRQLECLRRIFKKVFINTNSPELYFSFGVPLFGDIFNKRGPLTGVLSSLISTKEDEVFVIACDMPFIDERLIRYILENRGGVATIPVFRGRCEPLFSIYTKGIIESGLKRLMEDDISLNRFLKEINVKYIDEDEIALFDSEGRSFININTFEDLSIINKKEVI